MEQVFFVADIKITGNHLLYLYGWIDQKVFQHFLVAGTVQRKRHHSHFFGGEIPPGRWLSPALQVFFLLQSLIWSTKKKAKTRRKHSCQDLLCLRFPNRSSCQAFSPEKIGTKKRHEKMSVRRWCSIFVDSGNIPLCCTACDGDGKSNKTSPCHAFDTYFQPPQTCKCASAFPEICAPRTLIFQFRPNNAKEILS